MLCYGSSVRVRSFMPVPWKHGQRKKCSFFSLFLFLFFLRVYTEINTSGWIH